MLTPDITTLWVLAFLLLCTFLLNSMVFKPILHIIDQRTGAVRGARELAESATQKAAAATAEYDRKLNVARAEVYREMDEMRRAALERRAALLAATRTTIEQESAAATSRVQQESRDARTMLDREASSLAGVIVKRLLDRAS